MPRIIRLKFNTVSAIRKGHQAAIIEQFFPTIVTNSGKNFRFDDSVLNNKNLIYLKKSNHFLKIE